MDVVNEVIPSSTERVAAMMEPGPAEPVYMVNLLTFKELAEYEDGRTTSLSGREAYQLYAAGVTKLLPKFGGEAVFTGDVTFLSLGQVEELWDEIAIVKYPSRGAMMEMSSSAEWQEVSVHRSAGLAGQLNIETVGQLGTFG